MDNLWPKIETSKVFSPVALLREQANYLGSATNHVIVAEVNKITSSSTKFFFGFDLYAKAISYRFRLFSIYYSIDVFPVLIIPDERLTNTLKNKFRVLNKYFEDRNAYDYFEVGSQTEYVDFLKEIFNSPSTMRIISAMLSHIEMEISEQV